jgi:outer membrane lipoprotein-sorting protein
MSIKMAPAGQAKGQMAMAAAFMTMNIVDDGKNMWTYMAAMKQYSKGPTQSSSFKSIVPTAEMSKNATLKLLRTENLGGKPAHVIQVIPKNAPASAGKQHILVYIDQATSRFREMRIDGATPAQGNRPSIPMKMKMMVKSEQINAAIPSSVFKFTPPAGATEAKGMGAPGGNPLGGMFGGGGR